MLQKYNPTGGEGAVLKELEHNSPDNLQSLYTLMLSEVQQHRTAEKSQTLKRVFAWLAFSERPLTLEETAELVVLVGQDASFRIEDEIEGKSARILEIARPLDDKEDKEGTEDEKGSEDQQKILKIVNNDKSALLRFHERSLKHYLRTIDVEEAGLRTPPAPSYVIIFKMMSSIICGTYQRDGRVTANRVRVAAAKHLIHHLRKINVDTASEEDIVQVSQELAPILKNDNNVSKILEMGVSYSDMFGLTTDRHNAFLDAVSKIAQRASLLTEKTLDDDTAVWVKEVIDSPLRVMRHLAKGHVSNWFQKLNTYHSSYKFATAALLMTDLIPVLPANQLTSPSAETIGIIANAFTDVEKDDIAHLAIALTLEYYRHYNEAVRECQRALEKCNSEPNSFHILVVLARTSTLSEDDRRACNKKVYATINDALSIRPQNEKEPVSKEMALEIQEALIIRANCARDLNKMDEAVKSYEEARTICPRNIMKGDVLDQITMILEKKNDYSELMTCLEGWTLWERMAWLNSDECWEAHQRFKKAAKFSGKEAFMLKAYTEIIAYLDHLKTSSGARWHLANYYQTVSVDYKMAKKSYYQILNSNTFIDSSTGEEELEVLSDARLDLSDIIYQEFRSATNPKDKAILLDELKNMGKQIQGDVIDEGDTFHSNSAVVLANMARKLGPTYEFQEILDKAFRSCMDSLADTGGWDNQSGVCLLAKVLATVGGLEKEAQIAYSAQFSIIDRNVKRESSEDGSPCSSAQDIDSNSEFTCSGECGRRFHGWQNGPIYLCFICANCDLCEECYQKCQSRNRGEPFTHWQTYCGLNHKYIKGPVDGWKGIKHGYMTIGEEKTKFSDWLKELKETKWKKAWEKFWAKEDLMEDIV
ncbi:MAG: hypothetical protein M1834_008908 [Cirrosporium novae-zelandiae]|nr:MAG: hypothetical protein M1834_008908 [Cirrosporium novae-zelandiae]